MSRFLTSRGFSPQAIIVAFFIYVFVTLLIGYLPGSDEYLQAQASLNLKTGLSYTMLPHLYDLPNDCYDDCYPNHVHLSAYPPGYSLLIYLPALIFDHHISVIVIKFISIIVAYLSWTYFIVNYLTGNEYNPPLRLTVATFLTLISFQSTTDLLLASCIPIFFHTYKELVSNTLRTNTIFVFNLTTSFALLIKYQALFIAFPLYPIFFTVLFLRKRFNILLWFICTSLIPVVTTATYLGLSYVYTDYVSTQMINNWQIPNFSMTMFINFFQYHLWSYLDVVLNESFIMTKYLSRLAGDIPHKIRLIFTFSYFLTFSILLFVGLRTILKESKGIYLSFFLIVCISNSVCLLLLHTFSPSLNPDFNPLLYFRYHTFAALLLLLVILLPNRTKTEFLSRIIAIQFFVFTVVLVSIKAVEARHSLSLSADVNSYLQDIDSDRLLFFSDHRIWRSDWSTDTLFRYTLADFSDLPQALPPKTVIVLVCLKDNRGLLGQKVSEGCSNISSYAKKLRSNATEIERIDAGGFMILKGVK